MGIDGVRLDLYVDANGDGLPTLDEYLGTTTSATSTASPALWVLQPGAGNYIVVVDRRASRAAAPSPARCRRPQRSGPRSG